MAVRLSAAPWIEPPLDAVLKASVALLGVLAIAPRLVGRLLGLPDVRVVAWPGVIWMGAFFYLLILFGAADIVIGLAQIDRSAARPIQATWVPAAATALVVAGVLSALRPPSVRRVEVKLSRWPPDLDGFRIVQISDLHLGVIAGRRFAQRVAARCNVLKPDIIAITGDLVDGNVRELRDAVAPLAGLEAAHGVFFVTGNHDHYSGAKPWARKLTRMGIEVLRNRHVTIKKGDAAFYLAGTNDRSSGRYRPGPGQDLEKALEQTQPDMPVILLAHDPETFKQASVRNVDLQLSGHTHGGQLWPFGFFVRFRTRFIAGLYRSGDSQLYVSRGTGFWGPPMRVLSPAEITELVITRA